MTNQIIRGGSWRDFQVDARADYRFDFHPLNLVDYLGFRVIKKSQQGNRVIRGGSWRDDAQLCRSAYRFWFQPDFRSDCLGFRVINRKERELR